MKPETEKKPMTGKEFENKIKTALTYNIKKQEKKAKKSQLLTSKYKDYS